MCTVIFQTKAGRTPFYGRELLRLAHLTDSPASEVMLQRTVLANSLVNLKGKQGHSFETDRLVELLNTTSRNFKQNDQYFLKTVTHC